LLGLAVLAVVAAVVISRRDDRIVSGARVRYRCPMHPGVTALTAGECPICGMGLEPVDRGHDPASQEVSPRPSPVRDAEHGGYVVRSVLFTDNVRAPAWVESPGVVAAHLYLDELASLEPGAHGAFCRAGAPAVRAGVTLSADPPLPWDCCTSRVHLRLDPDSGPLPQGTTGWVRFAPRTRHAILIPSSAVIQSPGGPYVFAAVPDRSSWEPRSVRLGKVFFGNDVVLSGVLEHETLAVNDLFFLDAERRLRQGTGAPGTGGEPAR
jgi:hypothetical protein